MARQRSKKITRKHTKQPSLQLGAASIRPRGTVQAGSHQTITFTYTAGHPIDDTGYLKIVFRFAGDFGVPQFSDPQAPNYCTVSTTADCQLEPRWDRKGHTRPWGYALYLKVMKGFVNRGEKIIIVFGDTSGGSTGWRMQTFCEETFEFKTLVDPIATYEFKELPASPTLRVIPGRPARAVCIAPSQVDAGKSFTYGLKLEDRWGNPTQSPRRIRHKGFPKAGVKQVSARDPRTGLSAKSNPIEVRQPSPAPLRFWADFHGQSEETIGSNTIEDYYRFARDYGLVDICAHQGNDFQVTDEFWEQVNRAARKFYRSGSFVTFPGYEWSGNTPLGGDRNVYFVSEGGNISRSCCDLLPGKKSKYKDAPTAEVLFANLQAQRGPRAFSFAHVGGRYADVRMHDPKIECAMEVHSAWGTFEWLVEDALRLGYRVGICANSDGHKGRPGASYPGASKFGSLGGYTCVLAPKLSRQHIARAMQDRHFYATTGNRSLLDVGITSANGNEAMMGDVVEFNGGTPRLRVSFTGTGPIDNVEVRNGLEVIRTLRPYGKEDLGRRIKIIWSGAEVRGRARLVPWNGGLRLVGNSIKKVTPINFWNVDQPLQRIGGNRLAWQSITTGGTTGMILTLAKPMAGAVELETMQRRVRCAVKSLGLNPRRWSCGGLRKQIEMYRLPDKKRTTSFSFELDLKNLRKGDNPIYVRVTQEDGHMAWSSPVYLVRK